MEWRVKPIHQGEAPLSPCAAFVGVLEAQNWGNPAWKPSANPAAHASCTPECPARSALHDGRDQVLGLGLGSAGGRLRGSSPPASLPHGGQAGATLLYSQGLLTYDFTEACLLSPQLGPSRGQSGPPTVGGSSQKLLSLGNRGGCPRGSWSPLGPLQTGIGEAACPWMPPAKGSPACSLETWNRRGGQDHQIVAGEGGAGGAPGLSWVRNWWWCLSTSLWGACWTPTATEGRWMGSRQQRGHLWAPGGLWSWKSSTGAGCPC